MGMNCLLSMKCLNSVWRMGAESDEVPEESDSQAGHFGSNDVVIYSEICHFIKQKSPNSPPSLQEPLRMRKKTPQNKTETLFKPLCARIAPNTKDAHAECDNADKSIWSLTMLYEARQNKSTHTHADNLLAQTSSAAGAPSLHPPERRMRCHREEHLATVPLLDRLGKYTRKCGAQF